jgi:hypothetical protein
MQGGGIVIAIIKLNQLKFLTPKPYFMKTRAVAFSLMLTFTGCALFAQTEKKDTIPQDKTPKTDTVTTKKDTTISLNIINENLESGKSFKENSKGISSLKNEPVYAIVPAKENEKN